MDSNSTLSLVVDYEATRFIGKQDARIFDFTGGLYKLSNTGTTNLSSATHADVEADFKTTTLVANNAYGFTFCAIGWLDGTTKKYAVTDGSVVRTFNEAGTLIQTSMGWQTGTNTVNQMCTDGTYFYGVRTGSYPYLLRINVSDGQEAALITTSIAVSGASTNQGSYCLYDNGFVYSKANGPAMAIHKIDVITGATTVINDSNLSVSTYSVGGLITYALDGDPYIVELGSGGNQAYAFNIRTGVITRITHDNLSVSTEYGNTVLEVAPGVAQFHYNSHFVWIDVNTMTGSARLLNTSFGDGTFPSNLTVEASIANIPLHLIPGNKLPANLTHSLYADGVEITGA